MSDQKVLDSSPALVKPEDKRANGAALTARELAASALVGIWADRSDLSDSADYARQLRRQAEQRGRGSPVQQAWL